MTLGTERIQKFITKWATRSHEGIRGFKSMHETRNLVMLGPNRSKGLNGISHTKREQEKRI